jgi:hypothetical protein
MLVLLCANLYIDGFAHAQPQITHAIGETEGIRQAIVTNLGAPDNTVEMSRSGDILIVLRVNSTMNSAIHAHGEFNKEATAIASVVSRAIADDAEYKAIHTIRVQYLNRAGSSTKDRIIDTIDFRKNPNGAFELHSS